MYPAEITDNFYKLNFREENKPCKVYITCAEIVATFDQEDHFLIHRMHWCRSGKNIYVVTRVYTSFSLVENRHLLAERRTVTSFQWQTNHSNFRIINSQ